MNDVLISIRPQHVEKIISGRKKVELRRRRLNIEPGVRMWIYATRPEARVQAVATVVGNEVGCPRRLWPKIASVSGTSYKALRAYCGGSAEVTVLWLADVKRLQGSLGLMSLRREVPGFAPPQFFTWIPKDSRLFAFLDLAAKRS